MGIDLEKKKRGRRKHTGRRAPKSQNIYLKLLFRLYAYLARRTNSRFNKVVAKRLCMSRQARPAVSIAQVSAAWIKRTEGGKNPNTVVVIVGPVTDDHRLLKVPRGLRVCCLKMVENARLRVIEAGGQVLTFDELALREPLGKNTCLLRGPFKAGRKWKHFAGRPYTENRGDGRREKGKFAHVKRKHNIWRKVN